MLKKRRTLSDADCSSYTVILMTHPHRLNLSSTLMNREHQVVNWSERMCIVVRGGWRVGPPAKDREAKSQGVAKERIRGVRQHDRRYCSRMCLNRAREERRLQRIARREQRLYST